MARFGLLVVCLCLMDSASAFVLGNGMERGEYAKMKTTGPGLPRGGCDKGMVECQSGSLVGGCIPKDSVCNTFNDCGDASDEAVSAGCDLRGPNRDGKCNVTEFGCDNTNQCITNHWLCDYIEDCGDGSDEAPKKNCSHVAPQMSLECVDFFLGPNYASGAPGVSARVSGLKRTLSRMTNFTGPVCDLNGDKPSDFLCANGLCIPKYWQCDGWSDCTDASDEAGCPSVKCNSTCEVKCPNHESCIPKEFKCDGFNDCPDGADEGSCTTVGSGKEVLRSVLSLLEDASPDELAEVQLLLNAHP